LKTHALLCNVRKAVLVDRGEVISIKTKVAEACISY
jgi:hypothetical protein